MNFQVFSNLTEQQRIRWDAFVDKSKSAHFFQKSDWGKFQSHYMNKGEPVYVMGSTDDELKVVGLILKWPFLKKFFTYEVLCGPVASSANDLDGFLSFIEKEFGGDAISFEVMPRWLKTESDSLHRVMVNHGFRAYLDKTAPRYHTETAVVDLSPSVDEIFSTFRKTTRYEIRKEQKANIHVTIENDQANIDKFYSLHRRHSQRTNVSLLDKGYFEFLLNDFLRTKDNGFVAVASINDEPISGGIFLRAGDRVWYVHGASRLSSPQSPSGSHLLQWECMQHAKREGCAWYDLGGIMRSIGDKDDRFGVTLFKSGFSKSVLEYAPAYDKINKPLWHALLLLRKSLAFRKLRRLHG